MTTVGYDGTFVGFTFRAPILEQITGLHSGSVAAMLLMYGVSVPAGIFGAKNSPTKKAQLPQCNPFLLEIINE
jgi:MFS transporter, DHA1 family, inner membrane transport protein